MRKIKLTLKSETIRKLGVKQLRRARGGSGDSENDGSCAPWDCETQDADCFTQALCPSFGLCQTDAMTCWCAAL